MVTHYIVEKRNSAYSYCLFLYCTRLSLIISNYHYLPITIADFIFCVIFIKYNGFRVKWKTLFIFIYMCVIIISYVIITYYYILFLICFSFDKCLNTFVLTETVKMHRAYYGAYEIPEILTKYSSPRTPTLNIHFWNA